MMTPPSDFWGWLEENGFLELETTEEFEQRAMADAENFKAPEKRQNQVWKVREPEHKVRQPIEPVKPVVVTPEMAAEVNKMYTECMEKVRLRAREMASKAAKWDRWTHRKA
jgi:hypothetical protein